MQSRQEQQPALGVGEKAEEIGEIQTLAQLEAFWAHSLPGRPQRAVRQAFQFVEGRFAAADIGSVEDALAAWAERPIGSYRVATAILRATSRAKDMLPHWGALLEATRRDMQRQGLDWEGALSGLLPEKG